MSGHQPAPAPGAEYVLASRQNRRRWFAALGLALCLLIVYAAFPTRNHYWDGIGFALNIEGHAQDAVGLSLGKPAGSEARIYYNPNHLLHNLFGYAIYAPIHSIFPSVRALNVLAAVNMLLGALTAAMMFLMLSRWSGDLRFSLWLTLLMALSGAWWKFSTDANAYVPGVFFLVACACLLSVPSRRPPLLAIALLHAAGILVHQISLVFFPALMVAVWKHSYWTAPRRKFSAAATCAFAAGGPVLAAYLVVWFGVLDRGWSLPEFLAWVTFNGNDVYSYRSTAMNFLESARSLVRVFFGGRISLALSIVSTPLLAVLLTVMAVALGRLVFGVRNFFANPQPLEPAAGFLPRPFLAVWIGVFMTFLFFWLTEYPYYRLFYLPALVLLLATAARRRPRMLPPIKALVVFMAAFNFCFMIYPYSNRNSAPPIRFAHQARSMWPPGALVLYNEATCDNWIVKYFNPQTDWLRLDVGEDGNFRQVTQHIHDAFAKGRSVWLDTSVLGRISSSPELAGWLQDHGVIAEVHGISTERHHIEFAELVPEPNDPSESPESRGSRSPRVTASTAGLP